MVPSTRSQHQSHACLEKAIRFAKSQLNAVPSSWKLQHYIPKIFPQGNPILTYLQNERIIIVMMLGCHAFQLIGHCLLLVAGWRFAFFLSALSFYASEYTTFQEVMWYCLLRFNSGTASNQAQMKLAISRPTKEPKKRGHTRTCYVPSLGIGLRSNSVQQSGRNSVVFLRSPQRSPAIVVPAVSIGFVIIPLLAAGLPKLSTPYFCYTPSLNPCTATAT